MDLLKGLPKGIFRGEERYGAQVDMCHFGLVGSGNPNPSNFRATHMAAAPVLFNTRALHAPLPWEGERSSVIFYSAGGVLHCTPVWRQQLLSMGFRVPNASSNPSS